MNSLEFTCSLDGLSPPKVVHLDEPSTPPWPVSPTHTSSCQVVYLDEPSTGLDPASRRNLWDVVKAGKAGNGGG